MSVAALAERIAGFARARILVLGDVILDRYVWGSVERISPEAPVPVVRVTRDSSMLGGAGNVARNLVSLGGQVRFAAVVGDDETGAEIARLLADWKIDAAGLTADAARPTTVKTRVIARAQQVVRFDRESDDPIGPDAARRLVAAARAALPHVDGVILEDYGKGVLTAGVVEELMRLFADAGARVFVDPKSDHWPLYRGVELLKPNLREASAVTGIRVRRPEDVERVGRALQALSGARTLAITEGEEGMTLFHADGTSEHVATRARAVAEASGAGDTAIAALALARLAGSSWSEAARIANAAAGVVVGVPGTSTVSQSELLQALADLEDGVIRSMTGFGRAEVSLDGATLGAEVRSTNGRHLELRARLPRALVALEPALRAVVSKHFARGQVELSLRLPADASGGEIAVSEAAASRYVDAARRLAKQHELPLSLSAGALLALPGVVQLEEGGRGAAGLEAAAVAAVDAACREAAGMRRREGEALARDLAARVATVESAVGEIEQRASEVRVAAREKLRRRLAQLAGELELDPARFEQEVVYWVDRMDVTEEIVRLRAHLAAFRKDLDGDAPVGRRLEFLLQEIGREANTLGSKAGDAGLAALAVVTKTELEKIREQVHNVE